MGLLRLHDCQYTAGGLSDRVVYDFAKHFPLRVFLSAGGDASFSEVFLLIPLRYFLVIIRSLMLKGVGAMAI